MTPGDTESKDGKDGQQLEHGNEYGNQSLLTWTLSRYQTLSSKNLHLELQICTASYNYNPITITRHLINLADTKLDSA